MPRLGNLCLNPIEKMIDSGKSSWTGAVIVAKRGQSRRRRRHRHCCFCTLTGLRCPGRRCRHHRCRNNIWKTCWWPVGVCIRPNAKRRMWPCWGEPFKAEFRTRVKTETTIVRFGLEWKEVEQPSFSILTREVFVFTYFWEL